MVIIGSTFLDLQGDPNKGTTFVIDLGKQLEGRLGSLARWGFVIGAWCAVYSSMLGVWQSVPFLFADAWRLARGETTDKASEPAVSTRSRAYLLYQFALASIPAVSLWTSFVQMQKFYAIVGAFFVPILAVVLLALNSRRSLLGNQKSGWLIQAVLIAAVVFFVLAGAYEALDKLGS
jgi:Mn2+/Fe2+ NRAMP family transporter